MNASAPRIDGDRLWGSLMHSARIGATPQGGLCRLALSDEDREIRGWFAAECAALGATLEIDRMGSQFARFPGCDRSLPPIAIGSHLDTQPTGGRFDGVLGVLGGLEMVRALRQSGTQTRHDLLLINWTNEEGARFPPAMAASGVFAGALDLQHCLAQADSYGKTLGAELARIGYAGSAEPGAQKMAGYFELHIEQGPVLEHEAAEIGVVTGVQGIRWFDLVVAGQPCHAGTTPMALRQDPLVAAVQMAQEVGRIGHAYAPESLSTIGRFIAQPGARNTVPSEILFSVDLRHPDEATLDAMEARLRTGLPALAATHGCVVTLERIWSSPPVVFAPACVDAVQQAADRLGLKSRRIVSGAGHDAVYVARVAPTAMIFTPCRGGISHHPQEFITPEQAAAGAEVLLGAVLNYDAMTA
jgi:N-carbamoyl-L-amino-acid hydrolase